MIHFNNDKERADAQGILEEGSRGKFWSIIVQALEDNIIALRKRQDSPELDDLPGNEYKTEMKIITDGIKRIKEMKRMPESIASWLQKPGGKDKEKNYDPYET